MGERRGIGPGTVTEREVSRRDPGSNACGRFPVTTRLATICFTTHHVIGLSGRALWLRPSNIPPKVHSVKWKVQLSSDPKCYVILSWKNNDSIDYESWVKKYFNNRLIFMSKDLALSINASQQQDSGFYFLEVTEESGILCKMKFQVSVYDHVEKPRLQEQRKTLDSGMCQIALSCLVSKGENVTYAWYRGSKLIQTSRNLTHLVEQIHANSSYTYTCNVSNLVSWKSDTFNLTQGCLSAHQRFEFLHLMVIIVILLVILFLGTLTCFCVWRRKMKQPRKWKVSLEECLTIYEEINNLQSRRNQEQRQNPPRESNTIYSRIQPQFKSKKRNHSSSFKNTIYEVVEDNPKPTTLLDRP
ncbi:natural killer cell receptor 2B4 [Orycteropus afer afer]|uniref:Natural killer cell receptor 2B4 n=1 Tax=Orycteropus afer afer TaxID=1230840 RepID=A0A8B7ADC4_ORYAF|nr:natural killer cell receptor 2B4 [Orycteropus afer afer]